MKSLRPLKISSSKLFYDGATGAFDALKKSLKTIGTALGDMAGEKEIFAALDRRSGMPPAQAIAEMPGRGACIPSGYRRWLHQAALLQSLHRMQ